MADTTPSWPGERDPTCLDVENAHEIPEPSFLRDFKQALLARDIARDYAYASFPTSAGQASRALIAISGHFNDRHESRQFTYPLTILYDFPDIPDSEELRRLESSFWAASKEHVFLRAISILGRFTDPLPPHLRLSLACLASVFLPSPESYVLATQKKYESHSHAGKSLFSAGVRVWGMMLEVDNREARKFESVLASSLLITYGSLSADQKLWAETYALIGYTGAIARRLHMHDFCAHLGQGAWNSENSATTRTRSLLMSYQFLIDVVYAVHHNTSTQFSSSELFITMPASAHNFHDIYAQLILEEQPLPLNITEQEDAVLILSALLSDIIAIHKVFSEIDIQAREVMTSRSTISSSSLQILNPFVPLSPFTENQRMLSQISKGLDLWSERFKTITSEDVLSLFYFCNMCLSFPEILTLSRLSGYEPALNNSTNQLSPLGLADIAVPEIAVRWAWLIVDKVNVERLPNPAACPIWLPVVTYITALVVWASLRSSTSKSTYGSLKVLAVFKTELQQMPWPCCAEMTQNLDELMQAGG